MHKYKQIISALIISAAIFLGISSTQAQKISSRSDTSNIKNAGRLTATVTDAKSSNKNKYGSLSEHNYAVQETVTGTVTDAQSGETLPAVNILVKGTSAGTSTDSKGNFELTVESLQDTLVVSYIGYQTKEVPIRGRSIINIELGIQAISGEELVVVGYGTQQRKDLTGAITSISSEDLSKNRLVTNLDDALKGKLGGVRVIQNSGGPGAESTVFIRGATSLSGDNQPLYIVNGFPVENFDLGASAVESVTVLKDASATAIYGSRGANGVILVTTKKAEIGNPRINVNTEYGVTNLSRKVDVLGSQQYARQMYYSVARYVPASERNNINIDESLRDYYQDKEGNIWYFPKFTAGGKPYPFKNFKTWKDSTNTDWQDVMYRPTTYQKHIINFSSGTKASRFNLTLNYLGDEGMIVNNRFERLLGRLNLSQNITGNLDLESNSYYTFWTRTGFTNVVNNLLTRPPIRPADGKLSQDIANAIPGNEQRNLITSPLRQAEVVKRNRDGSAFQSNLTLNYEIIPEIELSIGGSYRATEGANENYTPSKTPFGLNQNGEAASFTNSQQEIISNNYLTYNETFGSHHDLTVLVGNSIEWTNIKRKVARNWNFNLEYLGFWGISGGAQPQVPNASFVETYLQSYFGRVNYAYKDKYLLKGTLRYDGSSKFAANNKWGSFPSAAFAWRVSEEKFAQSLEWLTDAKFRVSWGITGKQSISPYQSLSVVDSQEGTINGIDRTVATYTARPANPDLLWEKNREIDIGLDLSLFENRVGLTADVYRKITTDLLLYISTPSYTGYTSRLVNFGKLQNEGLELQLNSNPIQGKFSWSSNFNITFNRSEVVEIGEDNRQFLPNGILEEGEPIGVWYGYEQQGLWQSQAEIDQAQADGFTTQHGRPVSEIMPGDTKFVDQNGDRAIDADDRVKLGKSRPDFTGGFYNTISYRGFSVNIGLQFSYGAHIFNQSRIGLENGRGFRNKNSIAGDRWYPTLYTYDPENPDNKELVYVGNKSNTVRGLKATIPAENQLIDRYIEDGSFIRLSDLSISYNLPQKWIDNLKMRSARIFVSGKNLHIWTNYSGYDPEVNAGPNKSLLPGLDNGAYPRSSTIALGLALNF